MESMNVDAGLGARHQAEDDEHLPVATAAGCDAERFPALAGCENGWSLLDLARQLVIQGKPSLALQAVPCFTGSFDSLLASLPFKINFRSPRLSTMLERDVYGCRATLRPWSSITPLQRKVVMAIKSAGGDQAVLQTLIRAQELYINRVRADAATAAAADDLASLFAECAIAEAHPPPNPVPTPPLEQLNATNPTLLQDVSDSSILAQSGRMQIMLDAFADGSSFICLKCGGLVSNNRKDEHFMYWCG